MMTSDIDALQCGHFPVFFILLSFRQKFFQIPDVIRDPRCYRGRLVTLGIA
jgi:hypothetical protein